MMGRGRGKRGLGSLMALLLLVAAVVCTVTFYIAGEQYNARMQRMEQTEAQLGMLYEMYELVEKNHIAQADLNAALAHSLEWPESGAGQSYSPPPLLGGRM